MTFVIGAFILAVLLVCLILAIWALVDAAVRPDYAFRQAGQSKALWIILPIVGIVLFAIIGGILGVVDLVSIRPKLLSAQRDDLPTTDPSAPRFSAPPGTYAQPASPPADPVVCLHRQEARGSIPSGLEALLVRALMDSVR